MGNDMKWGFEFKLFLSGMLLGTALGAGSLHAQSPTPEPVEPALCYVPGAGGGSREIFEIIPRKLAERNILFIGLDNDDWGSIEERTDKTIKALERALSIRPNLKCHMMAYSMGGLMLRVAMQRSLVRHPTRGLVPLRDLVLSQTTMSTPHHGTVGAVVLNELLNYNWDPGMLALTEENIEATYNNPLSEKYAPVAPVFGKPLYIYRTFLPDHSRASSDVEKLGHDIIRDRHLVLGKDTRSDGVIPLLSQSITPLERFPTGADRLLGDFNVGHFYFSDGGGLPGAPLEDFFEVHYRFVTRSLPVLYEAYQRYNPHTGFRTFYRPANPNLRAGALGALLKNLEEISANE